MFHLLWCLDAQRKGMVIKMKDTRKADLFAKLFTKIINLAEDGAEATEILENCGMTQNEIDDAGGIETGEMTILCKLRV